MTSQGTTAPSYPPARTAAAIICDHLARHLANAHVTGADLPERSAVEAIIEAAFWASLRREEGYSPRISLALVAPEMVQWPFTFERSLPLAAEPLTRLSPAVERPGIHLGVWREGEQYCVWGATRQLPPFRLVLEVVAPGLLVVKHSRGDESEKFVNIAVLEGDRIKTIDEHAARLPDCPELLISLLGFDTQHAPSDSVNPLINLAVSMRAHGRGGSLLVVPSGSGAWQESIAQPLRYTAAPPFSGLSAIMGRRAAGDQSRTWGDAFRRTIDAIAGLTAVDGATVMTDNYAVLAFGAKIVRRRGLPPVGSLIVTEPIEGSTPEIADPGQLGGTRHLSAAQFVHDQRDAIALVASQDGRFTVFAWSPCEDRVHAHRIEALLL